MNRHEEFERGADQAVSAKKTFQQVFGPSSNYHFRAESAEEILDSPDKLQKMIMEHHQQQCPRLATLDDYIKAKNTGIFNDEDRRIEPEKADHRAAHNFAKVINMFDTGYNTGIPIKKVSDNEKINEIIKDYDDFNDAESLDAELWSDMKKYGRAYELMYRNEFDENHSVLSNVFETFVCYSLDVERRPLFAVRYPKYRDGMREMTKVTVYTDSEVIEYRKTQLDSIKLVEEARYEHYFGEVPVIEYSPDRYRQSGFEDVIPLIDLYDAAQSDTANYMTDLNEATLVISGDLNASQYSASDLVAMKRANLLVLENGINPDGSKSQTDAKYVYKQYDVAGTEAYKERLQKDIHKISLIPDLTDESFGGNQSGEAMKYKLFGFQQLSKHSQNGFKKGLTKRYRLLLNIKNFVNEASNTDLGSFSITFTPNLPKAVLEELKVLANVGTEFSQPTLLSLASFINDAQTEIERVEEEKKTMLTDIYPDFGAEHEE